ncbi:uncharacterized serine-rich protein C215.13-like [Impatiens glandulifera]|uniref:uncharacterized serine-rich protein C215.13-like n=1 Tax=Impatiens glandulifera TaxID=253017 RepID=UPI001FB114FC|nr:uncharacterized serine-rich protein C215.13-like [Impatiens glandulifera]
MKPHKTEITPSSFPVFLSPKISSSMSSPSSTFNGGNDIHKPSRRRLPSFSSSSSSSSSSLGSATSSTSRDNSPFSPSPLFHFSGMIPFSWEDCPGIPKTQLYNKINQDLHPSFNLLPLPPAGNTTAAPAKSKKKAAISSRESFKWDPFLAAMVECSRNEDNDHHDWKGSKAVTRSLSDRFGFIGMYNSCKRTCPVSESIIYVARPGPH